MGIIYSTNSICEHIFKYAMVIPFWCRKTLLARSTLSRAAIKQYIQNSAHYIEHITDGDTIADVQRAQYKQSNGEV